jgi:hypothetical protein
MKTDGGLLNFEISAGGSGYAVGDILTIVRTGASGGTIRALSVDGDGAVTRAELVTMGVGYAIASGLVTTVSPAGGSGCTVNVTALRVVTTLDLIRDIIATEMGLSDDRVIIYNQNFRIPAYDDLFVVIEYKGTPKVISNRNVFVPVEGDVSPTEEQNLNTQESIVVGLFSKNMEALQRKEEAVMALASIYSQQVQEANDFQIAKIAPIEDLSALEASALLYRFDIPVTVLAWYKKQKTADYYDSFDGQVRTEQITHDFEQPTIDPAA